MPHKHHIRINHRQDSKPRRTGNPLPGNRQAWRFNTFEEFDDEDENGDGAKERLHNEALVSLKFWQKHEPNCIAVESARVEQIGNDKYTVTAVLVLA